MRIQVASDIHLEHFVGAVDFAEILEPQGDVLALVGDIGTITCTLLPMFLRWCAQHFQKVFFVPGNHEYYNRRGVSMAQIDATLEEMCEAAGVVFLQNRKEVVGDYVFIGTTLWSYVPPEHKEVVEESLNDYQFIFANVARLTVDDTNEMYHENLRYITESLQFAKEHGKHAVVLTHHPPASRGTSHPMYEAQRERGINYAFTSTIHADALPMAPTLWCAGHTHYNFHFKHHENGYPLVSNQRGYPNREGGASERDYRPAMFVSLP